MIDNQPEEQGLAKRVNGPDASGDTIKSVISFIIDRCSKKDGVMVPARGAITAAAISFEMPKQTVSRFWVRAKQNYNDANITAYCASPKKRDARKAPI
jgi:hypothetical protein